MNRPAGLHALLSRLYWRALTLIAADLGEVIPPRRPLPPRASLIREESSMLVYKITPPPLGAPDVVKRTIRKTINGTALEPEEVPADAGPFEQGLESGDVFRVTYQDTDDAGNVSPESEALEFTAADTLAPPAPGAPTAELLREE